MCAHIHEARVLEAMYPPAARQPIAAGVTGRWRPGASGAFTSAAVWAPQPDPGETLDAVRGWYGSLGAPAAVQVLSDTIPPRVMLSAGWEARAHGALWAANVRPGPEFPHRVGVRDVQPEDAPAPPGAVVMVSPAPGSGPPRGTMTAAVLLNQNRSGGSIAVSSLYVEPGSRLERLGSALVCAAEVWGRNLGATRIWAAVLEGNVASRRLFAAAGFTPVCRYTFYAEGCDVWKARR